jgi:hypothetical protein
MQPVHFTERLGAPTKLSSSLFSSRNLIRNCPVTPDDARRALLIYGPDIAVLKGKMTRTAAAPRAPTFDGRRHSSTNPGTPPQRHALP